MVTKTDSETSYILDKMFVNRNRFKYRLDKHCGKSCN